MHREAIPPFPYLMAPFGKSWLAGWLAGYLGDGRSRGGKGSLGIFHPVSPVVTLGMDRLEWDVCARPVDLWEEWPVEIGGEDRGDGWPERMPDVRAGSKWVTRKEDLDGVPPPRRLLANSRYL